MPIAVPRAAAEVVALAGLGLLGLCRGLRRGQRHAWLTALVVLAASAAGHVVKGGDIEEAAVTAAAGYLWVHRSSFRAAADPPSLVRGLAWVGAAAAVSVAVVAVEVDTAGRARPPAGSLATATASSSTTRRRCRRRCGRASRRWLGTGVVGAVSGGSR